MSQTADLKKKLIFHLDMRKVKDLKSDFFYKLSNNYLANGIMDSFLRILK